VEHTGILGGIDPSDLAALSAKVECDQQNLCQRQIARAFSDSPFGLDTNSCQEPEWLSRTCLDNVWDGDADFLMLCDLHNYFLTAQVGKS
jgi:hypothetical protein